MSFADEYYKGYFETYLYAIFKIYNYNPRMQNADGTTYSSSTSFADESDKG